MAEAQFGLGLGFRVLGFRDGGFVCWNLYMGPTGLGVELVRVGFSLKPKALNPKPDSVCLLLGGC